MSICNKACLVPSIMLAIVDEMNSDSLVSFRGLCSALVSQVLEALTVINLLKLCSGGFSPLLLIEGCVKAHGIIAVPWDLDAMLELRGIPAGAEHGLFDHPEKLLVPVGQTLEFDPTRGLKKAVLPSMDCAGDGIKRHHFLQWFGGDLAILPFNHDVEEGTIAVLVARLEGPLVTHDLLEPPQDILFCIPIEEIDNLGVSEELFSLPIIHSAEELDAFLVLDQGVLVVIQTLDDMRPELLPIGISVHQE